VFLACLLISRAGIRFTNRFVSEIDRTPANTEFFLLELSAATGTTTVRFVIKAWTETCADIIASRMFYYRYDTRTAVLKNWLNFVGTGSQPWNYTLTELTLHTHVTAWCSRVRFSFENRILPRAVSSIIRNDPHKYMVPWAKMGR